MVKIIFASVQDLIMFYGDYMEVEVNILSVKLRLLLTQCLRIKKWNYDLVRLPWDFPCKVYRWYPGDDPVLMGIV